MLIIKLELVKKIFIENLKKRFIKLNIILYTLSILFIIKKIKSNAFI